MNWILDPDKYTCPDHGVDLTGKVRTAAIKGGVVIVSGADEDASPADLPFDEPYSPEGPFHVRVECPGRPAKPGDEAKPHRQSFEGVVRDA